VLWSKQAGYVDAEGKVLQQSDWRHIAIANPRLAPYGLAAMQTLDKLGLTDQVQPRVVTGENIGQTYQFAATGNAQLGFVAYAQVLDEQGQFKGGSMWMVPAKLYRPIRQDAVVLTKGTAGGQPKPAVAALMQYLRGDKARAVIQTYGYGL